MRPQALKIRLCPACALTLSARRRGCDRGVVGDAAPDLLLKLQTRVLFGVAAQDVFALRSSGGGLVNPGGSNEINCFFVS
jgi:hypothetical protein